MAEAALTPIQVQQLCELLEREQGELRRQLMLAGDSDATVELDQARTGRLTRMDALQQQQMAKAALERDNRRLRKIAAALKRAESDELGFCLECDELIGWERLLARPEVTLCLECQARSEN